jgi:hypothetical protein
MHARLQGTRVSPVLASVLCTQTVFAFRTVRTCRFIYLANRDFRISCQRFGSGIRCFFTPGSGMSKKSRSGSGIPDHISESLGLNTSILGC